MDPNSWQIATAATTVPPAIKQNGPSKEQCKHENQVLYLCTLAGGMVCRYLCTQADGTMRC
jgi:hypothetical protein